MSPGKEHCRIHKRGTANLVECKHCDWEAEYDNPVVAQRMASNHIVKRHPDIAKPAAQQPSEPKRPYTPRKQKAAIGANFCPQCGCNMQAVRVALSL